MKTCSKCGEAKPESCFWAHRRVCKVCRNIQANAQKRGARKRDPAKRAAQKRREKYGTDGAELFYKQGGRCAVCSADLASLEPRFRSLDHCHDTGLVRGWLCLHCNTGLGHFRDNPERLKRAVEYLLPFEIYK